MRSEVPLDAAAEDTAGEPDLVVRWAKRPLGERERGRLVGGFPPEQPFYRLRHDGRWWRLRFFRLGVELRIDEGGREMEVALSEGTDPAFGPVFVGGHGLTFALEVRGEVVLHASAIAIGDRALAIAGPPAAGKSTTAALACAGGARLVADDLLRVQWDADGVRCHPGGTAVRLRPDAEFLARDPVVIDRAESADGRVTATLPSADEATLPLAGIAVPRQSRDAADVEIHPLRGVEALTVLLSARRFNGWQDAEQLRWWLDRAAELSGRLPTFAVVMPHGTTRKGLGGRLVERLDEALGG